MTLILIIITNYVNIGYFNVVTVGISLWNTLPNSIKIVKSYFSFKMNIKSILLKLYT